MPKVNFVTYDIDMGQNETLSSYISRLRTDLRQKYKLAVVFDSESIVPMFARNPPKSRITYASNVRPSSEIHAQVVDFYNGVAIVKRKRFSEDEWAAVGMFVDEFAHENGSFYTLVLFQSRDRHTNSLMLYKYE